MLYQHKIQSRTATLLRRSLAVFAGFFGSRSRVDTAQLDGLTDRHLEELGLRRTESQDYRFF
jgi:hypothetical protein